MSRNTVRSALAELNAIRLADMHVLDTETLRRMHDMLAHWLKMIDDEIAGRIMTPKCQGR